MAVPPVARRVEAHVASTVDGWHLPLSRGVRPGEKPGIPVLFVPGFGMNSHIFRFHPRGSSFMGALLDAGLDPWSVDLRGSSGTRSDDRKKRRSHVGLADQAFLDLPAAIDRIRQITGHDRIHAIGCSLGGSLLYAHAVRQREHGLDRVVTMGTPLRWSRVGPLVRAFAMLAPLAGVIPMRGTRHMARVALPIVAKVAPIALSIYLNPQLTDTSPAAELSLTVEDPIPRVNRQLAAWIRTGDLVLDGIRVTEAMKGFDRPLMVVCGNGDGICTMDAALSVVGATGGEVQTLVVGGKGESVGHADLFISDLAPERVFQPIVEFLTTPSARA